MSSDINSSIGIQIFGEDGTTKDLVQSVVTTALQDAGFENVTAVNDIGEPAHLRASPNVLDMMRQRFPEQFKTPIVVAQTAPDDERYASDDPRIAVRDSQIANAACKELIGHIRKEISSQPRTPQVTDGNVYNSGFIDGFGEGHFHGFVQGVNTLSRDVENVVEALTDTLEAEIDQVSEKYDSLAELQVELVCGERPQAASIKKAKEAVGYVTPDIAGSAYFADMVKRGSYVPPNSIKPPYQTAAAGSKDSFFGVPLPTEEVLRDFIKALPDEKTKEDIEKVLGYSLDSLCLKGKSPVAGLIEMAEKGEIKMPFNLDEAVERLDSVLKVTHF